MHHYQHSSVRGNNQSDSPYYVEITNNFQYALGGHQERESKTLVTCLHCEFHDLHFHDLRHHATTMMLVSGVPESVFRKITSHKDLTTLDRYVDPDLQLNDAFAHFENYRADRAKAEQ